MAKTYDFGFYSVKNDDLDKRNLTLNSVFRMVREGLNYECRVNGIEKSENAIVYKIKSLQVNYGKIR